MDRSKGTLLLEWILSAVILIGVGVKSVSGLTCTYKTPDNYCAFVNISIETDTEARGFVFPNETLLWFVAPNFSQSGKLLFSNVPNTVKNWHMKGGSVPEVTIKSTLIDFRADGNHIRKVIIDETGPYSLEHLGIWNNQLRSVPENITKLTNLVELYLHENEIETINMNVFKNLMRLELLSLFGNKITRIDTTVPLGLPKLAELFLYKNYLDNLNISSWNFPSLTLIRLDSNKLRMIESFPDHFPKLNGTTLYYNRWNCSWLSGVNLWTDKILVYEGDESCSENSIHGICCEDDKKNYLVKTVADQLEQTSSKLQSTEAQIVGKIFALATEFKKNNAKDNENQAVMEDDRNKMEKIVENLKSDVDYRVHTIEETIRSEESRINAKVHENRALLGDIKTDSDRIIQKMSELKSLESNAKKQMFDKFQEINAKINENQALLEKRVDILKSDLTEQLSKTGNQIKHEINRLRDDLSEGRASMSSAVWYTWDDWQNDFAYGDYGGIQFNRK